VRSAGKAPIQCPIVRTLAAALLLFAALAGTAQAAPGGHSSGSLAYVAAAEHGRAGGVWLARADGSGAHRIAAGEAPLLSPDGRKLAFARVESRPGRRSLLILSPRRRVVGRYFRFPQNAEPLAWSPDSRYLAVWTHRSASKGPPRLAILDTVARRARFVARGWIEGVSFAPRGADRLVFGLGRRILYSAPRDLYVVGARGGRARRLTEDGNSLNPVWGPQGILYDRRTLRATVPTHAPFLPAYEIFLYRQGGSIQVTHLEPEPLVGGLVPVAVSADGSHLLANYYEERFGSVRGFPWAVDVPTGTAQPLTPLESGYVAEGRGISRDGSRVLVEDEPAGLDRRLAYSSIATIPFAGGPEQSLVRAAGAPSWSLSGNTASPGGPW
jgi:hypothetical protein